MTSDVATGDDVIVRREGRAGRLTLNRPTALNALTFDMVKAITAALQAWRDDRAIEVVVLDGAGEKALCAGGDVRWLYDKRAEGTAAGAAFWREEYVLNAMIADYPKPFVALMSGIVMGGGIGLSAHARYRIVSETSMLAMPETTIGLIPDVGGTYLLARAQGRLGLYLGLTGTRMSGSDAIQAGFADTYVSRATTVALVDALSRAGTDTVDEIIEQFAEPVPESPLAAKRVLIDRLFSGSDIPTISANLLTTTEELAQKAVADFAVRSPKALALTLEAIGRAKSYTSLKEALTVEYRLVNRLYEDGEFIEGVRALLVDKDKKPRWTPPSIAGVTSKLVQGYFEPLPAGLDLTWSLA